MNIIEKVRKNILDNNLIKDNDKILIAVSGGPDSMCLLDVLYNLKESFSKEYKINYELYVAHVNHKIRVESEDEKIYVENKCSKLNIPFFYLEANIPKLSKELKMSEETCGRKVRYDFFDEISKKIGSSKLAVAHNLNDNVETILLNIIRGCGLKGLIGMNYITENIIRPLLNIEKKDILEYCEIQKLNPCFDKTNEDDTYMRNKVRVKLIPSLKNEYNENIMQNIIRMKEIVSLDNDFLESYTSKIVEECLIKIESNSITFKIENFVNEHTAIKQRVIREIIAKKIGNLDGIEHIHVSDILKLLSNDIKGKKYIIGNKFTVEIIRKNVAIIY